MFRHSFWFLFLFLTLGLSWASPSCEDLLDSIENAFDVADEVVMTTEILRGKKEFAYSRVLLFKAAGEWDREILETRGQQRPESDDREEPSFEFSCEGHSIKELSPGWSLTLPEQDSEIPVKEWSLSFVPLAGTIVPISIAGDFEAKVLFISFNGSFSTRFSDWVVPISLPESPRER